MVIVLTICSANYMAHAKSLGDSLQAHNPQIHFVVGLVDRMPDLLDATYCEAFEVIPVEQLGLPQFEDMRRKYNIVELNTAVKPFYMSFLYEREPSVEQVIYLDPDILVYGSFDSLLRKLKHANIVLTPHLCSYDDSAANIYYEKLVMANGIYNLGFIGTSRSEETNALLDWWQIRLQDHCFYRPGIAGSFFDQLWMNLAPIYFRGVIIETNPGYNMCHWNQFERRLSSREGKYIVNDQHDLIFFHFSGYKPELPEVIVNRSAQLVPSFITRPELRPIYDDYRNRLVARNYNVIKAIPWHFATSAQQLGDGFVMKFLKNLLRCSVRILPCGARKQIKRLAQFTVQHCEASKP